MCGICGDVDFAASPEEAAVRRMARALAHRGPDAEGFFVEGAAALGHRRLSILDLSGGVQPMVREGVALVFNGQAYEHEELRERLRAKGHPFTTRSDTEVVLRDVRHRALGRATAQAGPGARSARQEAAVLRAR